MKLSWIDGRWVLESRFEERLVPKAAGFRWDPRAKVWYAPDDAVAAKLAGFASDADQAELAGAAAEAERAEAERAELAAKSRALSLATDAEVDVPAPAGKSYLPFQRAGIAYAALRPNTLIGDEMGLGKTIQALGLVNADPELRRVLVVCPNSLKLNWQREATRWLVRPTRVVVIESKTKRIPAADELLVIVNYDSLAKLRPVLDAVAWDCLVLDEVHYAKNRGAARSQAIWGRKADAYKSALTPLAANAKRRIALSGTPIPNRPIELWNLVHSFDPDGLGKSWFAFASRYCAAERTRYGWDASGSGNLDELQALLRERIMVRRLKDDVLTELPAKRRQVIELPANGSAALVERERAAFERHENLLADLRAAVRVAEIADDVDAHHEAVRALRAGTSAAFGELSKLRHEVALAKVPHVIEHVHDAVEASGAVVLFCHHKDVVAQVREALVGRGISVVVLTGDQAITERQAAVDAFQRGEAQVIILTIDAGREGHTLTRAWRVIFAELSWVPGHLSQAEDRCHRIGQQDAVLVQHLVLEGSLDARMAQVVIEKQEVISAALDGGGELPEAASAQDPLQAAIEALPGSEAGADPKKAARAQAEREAAALVSDADRELVHRCLQEIAAGCDGALKEDGRGFNKIDSAFGKRLAAQPKLIGRQVLWARRLVIRYGRQISPLDLARVRAIEIKLDNANSGE